MGDYTLSERDMAGVIFVPIAVVLLVIMSVCVGCGFSSKKKPNADPRTKREKKRERRRPIDQHDIEIGDSWEDTDSDDESRRPTPLEQILQWLGGNGGSPFRGPWGERGRRGRHGFPGPAGPPGYPRASAAPMPPVFPRPPPSAARGAKLRPAIRLPNSHYANAIRDAQRRRCRHSDHLAERPHVFACDEPITNIENIYHGRFPSRTRRPYSESRSSRRRRRHLEAVAREKEFPLPAGQRATSADSATDSELFTPIDSELFTTTDSELFTSNKDSSSSFDDELIVGRRGKRVEFVETSRPRHEER